MCRLENNSKAFIWCKEQEKIERGVRGECMAARLCIKAQHVAIPHQANSITVHPMRLHKSRSVFIWKVLLERTGVVDKHTITKAFGVFQQKMLF